MENLLKFIEDNNPQKNYVEITDDKKIVIFERKYDVEITKEGPLAVEAPSTVVNVVTIDQVKALVNDYQKKIDLLNEFLKSSEDAMIDFEKEKKQPSKQVKFVKTLEK